MKKSITTPRFVVYALCFPNGKPFYIGRGGPARPFAHKYEARNGCQCAKCETIRSIWRSGQEVSRFIMLATDDEQEATAHEADLIALHNLDTLTNKYMGRGYVRDRNKAVPKVDATGARHNETTPEKLHRMMDELFPGVKSVNER